MDWAYDELILIIDYYMKCENDSTANKEDLFNALFNRLSRRRSLLYGEGKTLPLNKLKTLLDDLGNFTISLIEFNSLNPVETLLALFNYSAEIFQCLVIIIENSIDSGAVVEKLTLQELNDFKKILFSNNDLPFEKGTFGEINSLDPNSIGHKLIKDANFSFRVQNRLVKSRIYTIADLCRSFPEELTKLPGIGNKSIDEINNYLSALQVKQRIEDFDMKSKPIADAFNFCAGNFESYDYSSKKMNLLKKAHSDLGSSLACMALLKHPSLLSLKQTIEGYIYRKQELEQFKTEIDLLIREIDKNRQKEKVWPYLNAFSLIHNNYLSKMNSISLSEITFENLLDQAKVENFLQQIKVTMQQKEILEFLKWCSFDIADKMKNFYALPKINHQTIIVLKRRAEKATLEEIGDELSVTRERIRQIEQKGIRYFNKWNQRQNIQFMILAQLQGISYFSRDQLTDLYGAYSSEIAYLLSKLDCANMIFDKKLGLYLFNMNEDEISNLHKIKLPELIHEDEITSLVKERNTTLPESLILHFINSNFKKTEKYYHRTRLTKGKMYEVVLKKYFPDGMYVYDPVQINIFKNMIHMEFGENIHFSSNRAISARIANIGILCDKGKYKAKQDNYISHNLLLKIREYMDRNQFIMVANIFAHFKKDLKNEGIQNRYYLQGILRHYLDGKFYFKKDYISRSESDWSIYDKIIDHLANSRFPLDKEALKLAFPGVKDFTIGMALNDEDVLNYFGSYMHCSQIQVKDTEKTNIQSFLDNILKDNKPHHITSIFEIMKEKFEVVMSRNGIFGSYGWFSLLKYLLFDNYQFIRPYIAYRHVVIDRPNERIKEDIKGLDDVDIRDLLEFLNENHVYIPSVLDFLVSLNDSHFIYSKSLLVSIKKAGFKYSMLSQIENSLISQVKGWTLISTLDFSSFPQLDVNWSEWLLFSIIKKHSNLFEVDKTNSQFRMSKPVISYHSLALQDELATLSESSLVLYEKASNDSDIDIELEDYLYLLIDEEDLS